MDFYQSLTVANFVLTVGILVLLAVSLLPSLKQGLVVVRDAVLWSALIVLLCFLAWLGIWRWDSGRSDPRGGPDGSASRSAASWSDLVQRSDQTGPIDP